MWYCGGGGFAYLNLSLATKVTSGAGLPPIDHCSTRKTRSEATKALGINVGEQGPLLLKSPQNRGPRNAGAVLINDDVRSTRAGPREAHAHHTREDAPTPGTSSNLCLAGAMSRK